MRADVNVSVRKPGGALGTRTETKNVNSVRFIMAAIEHEASRQVDLLEGGGSDRPGNPPVRSRQGRDAQPALQGGSARLPLFPRSGPAPGRARRRLPRRMPRQPARAARRQAPPLRGARSASPPTMPACSPPTSTTARWFEALLADARRADAESPSAPRNWVISDLFGALNRLGKDIEDSPVTPAQGAELLAPHRRRHPLRHARQAGVRDHARDRRGSRRDRRGARPQADLATPARSRPPSPRCSPPTPTRSPNIAAARTNCSASSSAR